MLTVETTNARLQSFIAEDRVRPRLWNRTEADGRELACLLGALDQSINSASMCPEEIMPPWMAHFTVFATDNVTPIFFPTLVLRFGAAYPRFPLITPTGWRRVLAKTMIKSLTVAMIYDMHGVVAPVIELWTNVKNGDEPLQQDWVVAAWERKDLAAEAEAEAWAEAAAEAAAWAAAAALAAAAWAAAAALAATALAARAAETADTIILAWILAIEDEIRLAA